MKKVNDQYGNWIFITPIGNLILTEAVEREYKVGRVIFVNKNKLPRIRRRLGFKTKLSEIKQGKLSPFSSKFFESSETYAIVRQRGKPNEIETNCLRLVKDALSILALSQLGYANRRYTSHLSLLGEHEPTRAQKAFINSNNGSIIIGSKLTRSPTQLVLDNRWKAFQK